MQETWDDIAPFDIKTPTPSTPVAARKASSMPTPPVRKPSVGGLPGVNVIPSAGKPKSVLTQLRDAAVDIANAEAEEEALLAKHGLSTSPVRGGLPYESLNTAGSGNRPASRNVALPPLAVKDNDLQAARVPPKKALRTAPPARIPTSVPPVQPAQATNGLTNGSKLTYTRPVRKATGEVVETESTIVITESDIRKVMFLAEYGCATRKQLDALETSDPDNSPAVTNKNRKRNKMLIDAGIIQMEGTDQGFLTEYSLTPTGQELAPDSFTLKGAEAKAEDIALTLNRATLAINFISPQEDPILPNLVNPLSVVSRNRIMADSREMNAGKAMREQQRRDLEDWLSIERVERGIRSHYGYPIVDENWTYEQMDEKTAVKIDAFFRKGCRAKDGTILKPSYIFNTYDENGRAENLIDFVVALPHMRVRTPKGPELLPQCLANVLALVNQTDAYWQTLLGKIANSPLGYAKLIVWVPGNVSIAASVERNWETLKANHFIPTGREDMLHVQSYDPMNANKDEYSMYTPDVAGKAAKHYFKG